MPMHTQSKGGESVSHSLVVDKVDPTMGGLEETSRNGMPNGSHAHYVPPNLFESIAAA